MKWKDASGAGSRADTAPNRDDIQVRIVLSWAQPAHACKQPGHCVQRGRMLALMSLICVSFLKPTCAQVEKGFLPKRFNSVVVQFEPPPRNGFLIDFDCAFAWMGGETRTAGAGFAPGVFVYSKPHARWLHVLQVSTAGAQFGKSPPQALIQAPWDFTGLASNRFISLPINSGGAMHYPGKVTLDESRDAFVLLLDSNWQMDDRTIESARTALLLPRKDLLEAFDYYSGSKPKAPSPQGGADRKRPSSPDTNRAPAVAHGRSV